MMASGVLPDLTIAYLSEMITISLFTICLRTKLLVILLITYLMAHYTSVTYLLCNGRFIYLFIFST